LEKMSAKQRRISKAGVAGLVLALWFVLEVLAVSPQAHHWLHNDSGAPNHQCFLVQLNKGSLLSEFQSSPAPMPSSGDFVQGLASESCLFPSFDFRISPSRAPPFLSSSTAVVG
jgi:hypothetical protein